MKKIIFIFTCFFALIFYVTCLTTFITYSDKSFTSSSSEFFIDKTQFSWPLENYHDISSYFGFRIHPVTKKISYHSGIDIPAPEGTTVYSISNGTVLFTDFDGANGYTIMIQENNITHSYSHLSSNFIVNIGDKIEKHQHIADVGPKYIPFINNNPYKDFSGKQTNGLTTGTHLHLSIKIDDKVIDPITFFDIPKK